MEQLSSFGTPLFEIPVVKPVSEAFHSFIKLPVELRWLIWTLYLQQPRIITLQLTPQPEPSDRPYLFEMQKLYRPSTLLSVNQEARRAA